MPRTLNNQALALAAATGSSESTAQSTVTAANIVSTGSVYGNAVVVQGNVTAANLVSTGYVYGNGAFLQGVATGSVAGDFSVSGTTTTDGIRLGNALTRATSMYVGGVVGEYANTYTMGLSANSFGTYTAFPGGVYHPPTRRYICTTPGTNNIISFSVDPPFTATEIPVGNIFVKPVYSNVTGYVYAFQSNANVCVRIDPVTQTAQTFRMGRTPFGTTYYLRAAYDADTDTILALLGNGSGSNSGCIQTFNPANLSSNSAQFVSQVHHTLTTSHTLLPLGNGSVIGFYGANAFQYTINSSRQIQSTTELPALRSIYVDTAAYAPSVDRVFALTNSRMYVLNPSNNYGIDLNVQIAGGAIHSCRDMVYNAATDKLITIPTADYPSLVIDPVTKSINRISIPSPASYGMGAFVLDDVVYAAPSVTSKMLRLQLPGANALTVANDFISAGTVACRTVGSALVSTANVWTQRLDVKSLANVYSLSATNNIDVLSSTNGITFQASNFSGSVARGTGNGRLGLTFNINELHVMSPGWPGAATSRVMIGFSTSDSIQSVLTVAREPNATAGNVGINTNTPTYKLHVVGNTYVEGFVYATADITAFSDLKLKSNLNVLGNALNRVCQISGYTYDRIDIPGKRHAGVVAQEVRDVLPEAVVETQGTLTVAHASVMALLVQATKELSARVDALAARLDAAVARLDAAGL